MLTHGLAKVPREEACAFAIGCVVRLVRLLQAMWSGSCVRYEPRGQARAFATSYVVRLGSIAIGLVIKGIEFEER